MLPRADANHNCDLLFVYGTLRRGFDLHHNLVRLGARYFGKAKVAGELFDLGVYPGAHASRRKGKWIHGEIYRLRRPGLDFRVLDECEEFNPCAPERSMFVREMTRVVVAGREPRWAWIYWMDRFVPQGRHIASGDYLRWGEGDARA